MTVEDLCGNFPDCAEVILQEIQIRFHGLDVLVIDGGQFKDFVFLDAILEHGD